MKDSTHPSPDPSSTIAVRGLGHPIKKMSLGEWERLTARRRRCPFCGLLGCQFDVTEIVFAGQKLTFYMATCRPPGI